MTDFKLVRLFSTKVFSAVLLTALTFILPAVAQGEQTSLNYSM